jgi:hypothetical protein
MRPCFGVLLIAALASFVSSPLRADDARGGGKQDAAKKVDFARDIRPILAARCWSCHGEKASEGGLRLHNRAAVLAGGDSGQAMIPGKSAESRLVRYVTGQNDAGLRMPPETNGEPLAAGQIALLKSWIDQGVPWADEPGKSPAGEASKHWSFQPIRRPRVPTVRNIAWVRNAIDAFVLAELERRGIEPSLEADRATLLRRVSLDLVGLPPTPDEVQAFAGDTRPDAYERAVDRLLASPHYGERWARHWLDLARYADSDGYEKDLPRPHAWRFRQWVIDALNRDLPFDEFTIDQLAGDLLLDDADPRATLERKIATGFHRNTLTNREGGIDPEEDRVKQTIDRTNTTGTIWLGLTVECAQCHSHKYDPLSQREYYALYAFFNGLQEVDVSAAQTLAEAARPRETHLLIRGDFLRPGDKVEPETPAVLPPLDIGHVVHAARVQDGHASRVSHETSGRRATRLDLARWLVDARNPLTARVTVNRAWQRFFGQGLVDTSHDFGTQGSPPTHPALLDYLASEFAQPSPLPISSRADKSVRRTEGRGGWSQKALHRLIVTSATYRQSSRARPELREVDPNNRSLARQNRLRVEAEVVRDLALAASGLLEPRIGGRSVRPPQPAGIDALGYAGSVKWAVSSGADRYRRGLYTFFQRTVPYPMFKDFDAPDGNITCTRRERSNTPISALTMQNDPVFVECCQAFARRLIREEPGHGNENCDRAGRVNRVFAVALGRRPSQEERGVVVRLHEQTLAHFRSHPDEARQLAGTLPKPPGIGDDELAAWAVVGRTVMNLDEFITRE